MMSKTVKRAAQRVAAACMLWGSLVGLNGGAAAPPAYALQGSDTDPCFPQTVTAADAELVGTLRLLDPAMVGYESRISMSGATLRLPNPRCDGQYITVPLTYSWAIVTRPSGSVAALTQTTTLVPRLTPDRAG